MTMQSSEDPAYCEATIDVVLDAIVDIDLVDNYAIVINKVPQDPD